MSYLFNVPTSTELYNLSLHDALPILRRIESVRDLPDDPQAHGRRHGLAGAQQLREGPPLDVLHGAPEEARSEEHTSELQSRQYLVCRLLLEKKKYTFTLYIIAGNSKV